MRFFETEYGEIINIDHITSFKLDLDTCEIDVSTTNSDVFCVCNLHYDNFLDQNNISIPFHDKHRELIYIEIIKIIVTSIVPLLLWKIIDQIAWKNFLEKFEGSDKAK